MNKLTTPTRPENITPLWLTKALHSRRSQIDVSVTDISYEIIGIGKGFMNQTARLSIEYNRDSGDFPLSLIAKLSAVDPLLRQISDLFQCGQRENRYYQEIASDSGISVPTIYYSSFDESTNDRILLMEDMSDARQGDSVAGCSLSDVELAVDQLAMFHHTWWQSPRLSTWKWLPLREAETAIYKNMYPDAWKLFVRIAGKEMSDTLRTIGDRLGQNIPEIKTRLSSPPRTITHGDYRLDNCFLDPGHPARQLVVIDWEFCSIGRGPFDVASFINEAFQPDQRKLQEMPLLHRYHSLLMNQGVSDYSFEECLRDYRISMLEIFMFWIVIGAYCDWDSPRGRCFFNDALKRFDATLIDLDCAEFLSS